MQANRDRRNSQLLPEQASAGLERLQVLIVGAPSFGKNEHAVTPVDRLARMLKTPSKPAQLRQRKNIEQRCDHPVFERRQKVEKCMPLIAPLPPVENHFA